MSAFARRYFPPTPPSDWSYEALQRNDDRRRLHLSGFNARGASRLGDADLQSRDGRPYDDAEVSFLNQPNGGKAEVLLDGKSAGEIDLDGGAGREVTFEAHAKNGEGVPRDRSRTLDDAPVAVTGVKVGREGDGVSYLSIGYPGATVQLLQKLDSGNVADDFRRLAPDVMVLAFGTNEGFNDNLDVSAYISQYEQIVRRLQALRPGVKIVHRRPGRRGAAGRPMSRRRRRPALQLGRHRADRCVGTPGQLQASRCRRSSDAVREAQRKLAAGSARRSGTGRACSRGPCGAQVWAAANPPLMAHDYVHMTLEGYKQSADQFADFLIPLIEGRPAATHVVSNN